VLNAEKSADGQHVRRLSLGEVNRSCAGKNALLIRFGSAMGYMRTQPHRANTADNQRSGRRCTVIRNNNASSVGDSGPRFVTGQSGATSAWKGWTGNRLDSVRVSTRAPSRRQRGFCSSRPIWPARTRAQNIRGTVSLSGKVIATIENRQSKIEDPQLWWPCGQGAQPLYQLEVEVTGTDGAPAGDGRGGSVCARSPWIAHADQWGQSLSFVVNGRPIFAKGANWIPAHSFVAGLARADYERDLRSAAEANMTWCGSGAAVSTRARTSTTCATNLGCWCAGFMFACTLYPADAAFLAGSRTEADYQIRRLRHRACLALWCGNNEVFAATPICSTQTRLCSPSTRRFSTWRCPTRWPRSRGHALLAFLAVAR